MREEFCRSYNGFAGMNMTAWVADKKHHRPEFGHVYADIQAISISSFREMAPIYTMGPGPQKPSQGVCGALIFKKFYHPEPMRVFNIELMAADEYGKQATLRILGASIWEEGEPWDPRNMYEIETQYCYMAEKYVPWKWTDGTPCNDL